MNTQSATLSDPAAYRCQLGREGLVGKVARQIANGNPSLSFGVHGD